MRTKPWVLVLWAALAGACSGSSASSVVEPVHPEIARKQEALVGFAHCLGNEGDPRGWPAHDLSGPRDWELGPEYASCSWYVERSARGIQAVSDEHRPASRRSAPRTLPFEPNWVPKHQVVWCGDGRKHPEPPAQTVRSLTELREGFLVGFNAGEWGGGLYWYTRDGAVRQQVIDDNVVSVAPLGSKYLVVTGLAHLTFKKGRATLLDFDGQEWKILRSFDLGHEPGALLDEADGAMLIATNERLLRLTKAGRVEVLHESVAGWSYPTSLVRDGDGTLYLGHRGAVVRLRSRDAGYTETWLTPPGAVRPLKPSNVVPEE